MQRASVRGGAAAWPSQLGFCLSLLGKRLLQTRRFRLVTFLPRRGGFLSTLWRLRALGLNKVVATDRGYHFSLVEPRWPSPAHDEMVAGGGLNVLAAGTSAKTQVGLAVLGVTRLCSYRCSHCYERANLGPADVVPVERWLEVIREMQQIGVGVVALSGGEPLSAPERVLAILAGADKRRSDFHLFTAGQGATPECVEALVGAGLAGAGVGLDHHDPAGHDALRGQAGAGSAAMQAIRRFADSGILTYVSTCLRRELVCERDGLRRLYERVHGLGAAAWQLLEPKPCGALAGRSPASLLSEGERVVVRAFVRETQHSRAYRRYPAACYPALWEAPKSFGCLMGGLSHLYIDSCGNVEPCVFLPVRFGNILEESFTTIFRRMRCAVPRPIRAGCPAVVLPQRVDLTAAGGPLPRDYASVQAEWESLLGAAAANGDSSRHRSSAS